MLFSQRHGYKPVREIIQVESIDDELRNSLWNVIHYYFVEVIPDQHLLEILEGYWAVFLKKPIDEFPKGYCLDYFRDHYYECEWYEVYDLLEFLANHKLTAQAGIFSDFIERCNAVLENELSAYRFVDSKIAQITDEKEISEIEEALDFNDEYSIVKEHLYNSLEKLSDRQNPDYRNSIKESVSAVEAICNIISGKKSSSLKDAFKALEQSSIQLHQALKDAFNKLYGYTSDADGIRHALIEESKLNFEDAKFMLVACSAFINYLKAKAAKVGTASANKEN